MKEKINELLAEAVTQAGELLADKYVDEGLDILLKVSGVLRNLSTQPETPERHDLEYQAKSDEDLVELARRAAKSNS